MRNAAAAPSRPRGTREPLGMAEFVRDLVAAADRFGPDDVEGMRAAIGEPIRGRPLAEISIGQLLGQRALRPAAGLAQRAQQVVHW